MSDECKAQTPSFSIHHSSLISDPSRVPAVDLDLAPQHFDRLCGKQSGVRVAEVRVVVDSLEHGRADGEEAGIAADRSFLPESVAAGKIYVLDSVCPGVGDAEVDQVQVCA